MVFLSDDYGNLNEHPDIDRSFTHGRGRKQMDNNFDLRNYAI